jgi:ubiquinone/menaquinone biosynthesis C-methylase UbiE
MSHQGWQGWDEYADFYDWENARTIGRRDVPFWRALARAEGGGVLELGCGTGRLLVPLARSGIRITGIDRSTPMLARAVARTRRLTRSGRPRIVRGDIRQLPFADDGFRLVMAPYGLVQSLVSDRDLSATLREAARVAAPGGLVGFDLVPDLPAWKEYRDKVIFRGRSARGVRITLVESVRQDRRRGVTVFDDTFVDRRGARVVRRRFTLTFRTLELPAFLRRLGRAGLAPEAVFGGYRGGAWTPESDAWIVLARKC